MSSAWRSSPIPTRERSWLTRRARSSSTSAWTSSSFCAESPCGVRSPRASSFQDGDIVEHGEESDAEATDGGIAPSGSPGQGSSQSLGIGSLKGWACEPPASLVGADHASRMGPARQRGAGAADRGAHRPQARRLLRRSRLGALCHQPRSYRGDQPNPGQSSRCAKPSRPTGRRAPRPIQRLAR